MNFLAGLFYFLYEDEAVAYSMFTAFISTLKLANLYKQGVPLLKMYCHQMNRLIAVYLPRLHVHMYEEGISSTYFCSAWFLTSFTFVLQCNRGTAIPALLLSIVDRLLMVTS